jgi:anti-sigma28 factor (negative regulator of flagellin synthesis)
VALLRINDTNRTQYALIHYSKQASTSGTNRPAESKDSVDTSDRAQKVEKLKQMVKSGQPVDVNKLADAMVRSGVLFDEKA